MKIKTLIAISASILVIGANLFVISAKQGSVNSKVLLSKVFSFNHFAYATDPGFYGDYSGPTGSNYPNGVADCSSLTPESYDIDVSIGSNSGQKAQARLYVWLFFVSSQIYNSIFVDSFYTFCDLNKKNRTIILLIRKLILPLP